MKVYMGKYPTWVGPYQIAEMLCFWAKPEVDEYGIKHKPDWVHNFGRWLSEDRYGNDSWITTVCQWYHKRFQRNGNRKVKVRIDNYDIWSAYDTIAYIVAPMLRKLRENKHGAPHVYDDDVPEHLRSTAARELTEEEKHYHAPDEFHFKRWDWVLDEMIWAFEQVEKGDWEDQFHKGKIDFVSVPVDKDGNELPADQRDSAELFRMDRGPNDTHVFDKEGYTAHYNRMQNGFKLFGKYYMALWD